MSPALRGVLAAALAVTALAACGGGEEPEPLPECETPPSFSRDLRPGVVELRCLSCHSETRTGALRSGAPEGMNFDRLELFADARSQFVDSITSGRQPPPAIEPPNPVTEEERALVARWRLCGYAP